MTPDASGWQTAIFATLNSRVADVVGAKTAQALASLRITTVGDLLKHVPRRYLSGTELTDLATLEEGDHVAVIARVADVARFAGRQRSTSRLEARLTDGHGGLTVTFFGADHLVTWWDGQLRQGERGIFVGKVGRFRDRLQMTHPEFVMLDASGRIVGRSEKKELLASISTGGLVGLYPATAALPTWKIADCVRLALGAIAGQSDPWPDWVRAQADVVDLTTAFSCVHTPEDVTQPEVGARRLRFDEALATQLTMAYRRADASRHTAVPRPRVADGILTAFDARLPYRLTDGQEQVCQQIMDDLARTRPMQRLLQGEVGSGKTVVALRAILTVVDNGGQAALLAPTEVLATQHYQTIRALLGDLGAGRLLGAPDVATDVVLLTGSMPTAARREALLRVASGEAGIVIGTHALLAEQVKFADLGLVVVDEQHRFGVEQRAVLTARAATRPHVLVLTATPIPRSVAMTVFGDLDISTLAEIPKGRAEVSTVLVDVQARPQWVNRVWERILEEVELGRQAFVVCPRIGGNHAADQGKGVVELHRELTDGPLRALRVGVLHGQLPAEERSATMAAFVAGDLDVIVATTVIEVGVDVPNATVMVIWDADRFGISQLHQLRGRIGRGQHPGVCLLLTQAPADSDARARLAAVCQTRDGFVLAEIDLAQRREGDVLGAEQSGGRSSLRLLRVLEDAEIIAVAKEIAAQAVQRDPSRRTPGFADAVRQTEHLAAADWMERT